MKDKNEIVQRAIEMLYGFAVALGKAGDGDQEAAFKFEVVLTEWLKSQKSQFTKVYK